MDSTKAGQLAGTRGCSIKVVALPRHLAWHCERGDGRCLVLASLLADSGQRAHLRRAAFGRQGEGVMVQSGGLPRVVPSR
jgi:hypothetical protein